MKKQKEKRGKSQDKLAVGSEQKESNGILHPGGYRLLFSSSCQLASAAAEPTANYSRYALCPMRLALFSH